MVIKSGNTTKNALIILGILGICILAYFLVIGPYLNRGEGDPYFVFFEVSVNATLNRTVIHLEDKDIVNVQGLDVKFENGKLTRIYFRHSDTVPAIHEYDFYDKFGSRYDDPSSRKYLEYNGVYYYATLLIP